jgi:hypothetical protein
MVSQQRFILEGGLATRETFQRSEAVPLNQLLEGLTAYQPLELDPVPKNTRYMSVTPRGTNELQAQIIVANEPMTRRISYKNVPAASDRRVAHSYNLQFPYSIFWFAMNGNKLQSITGDSIVWNPQAWGYIWMKEPFTSLDQMGWTPQMPNIYGDSRICFGANPINGSQPLGHYIDETIATFWTSEFNQDLENVWPYPSMNAWEEAPAGDWEHWDVFSYGGQNLKDKFGTYREDQDWTTPVPTSIGQRVPPLPQYHTFNSLRQWLAGLTEEERERLRETMTLTEETTDDER